MKQAISQNRQLRPRPSKVGGAGSLRPLRHRRLKPKQLGFSPQRQTRASFSDATYVFSQLTAPVKPTLPSKQSPQSLALDTRSFSFGGRQRHSSPAKGPPSHTPPPNREGLSRGPPTAWGGHPLLFQNSTADPSRPHPHHNRSLERKVCLREGKPRHHRDLSRDRPGPYSTGAEGCSTSPKRYAAGSRPAQGAGVDRGGALPSGTTPGSREKVTQASDPDPPSAAEPLPPLPPTPKDRLHLPSQPTVGLASLPPTGRSLPPPGWFAAPLRDDTPPAHSAVGRLIRRVGWLSPYFVLAIFVQLNRSKTMRLDLHSDFMLLTYERGKHTGGLSNSPAMWKGQLRGPWTVPYPCLRLSRPKLAHSFYR